MSLRIVITSIALVIFCYPGTGSADSFAPFRGVVTSNGIHIRADSTVSAPVICDANKGDILEVYGQLYEWYKVALPRNAPSFIRKDLIQKEGSSTASVINGRVNVRLEPNESSAIIGRAIRGEVVIIVADLGEWCKIEPVRHSTGWIHKQFVNKSDSLAATEPKEQPRPSLEEQKPAHASVISPKTKEADFTIEGIVRPQGIFFQRKTTHKVLDNSGKVYLLRADKATLNQFNNCRAKITGALRTLSGYKYPVIDVKTIEYLE